MDEYITFVTRADLNGFLIILNLSNAFGTERIDTKQFLFSGK